MLWLGMSRFLLPLLFLLAFSLQAADRPSLDEDGLGKLKLDLTAAEVTALLGNPESKGEDVEWGATGEWVQEWSFKAQGLVLNMASVKKGGAKTLLSITATPPCKLSTARGIHIGSSLQEVSKAYGDVHEKQQSRPGESFVAGSLFGGIIFDLKQGKVSEIFIGAAAE